MSPDEVPLAAWELKQIAKILESVERKFGDPSSESGLTAFGKQFYDIRLDVLRPDTDEVIGTITYYDGWLGFYPVSSGEDNA